MNWEDDKTPVAGVEDPPTIVYPPLPYEVLGAVLDLFVKQAIERGLPYDWRQGDRHQQHAMQLQVLRKHQTAHDSGRIEDVNGTQHLVHVIVAALRAADLERLKKPRR